MYITLIAQPKVSIPFIPKHFIVCLPRHFLAKMLHDFLFLSAILNPLAAWCSLFNIIPIIPGCIYNSRNKALESSLTSLWSRSDSLMSTLFQNTCNLLIQSFGVMNRLNSLWDSDIHCFMNYYILHSLLVIRSEKHDERKRGELRIVWYTS